MAKPNYAFAKRQRELAKKQKQEAKRAKQQTANDEPAREELVQNPTPLATSDGDVHM